MNRSCRNCEYFGIENDKFYCDRFDVYLENNMLDQVDVCDDFQNVEMKND